MGWYTPNSKLKKISQSSKKIENTKIILNKIIN